MLVQNAFSVEMKGLPDPVEVYDVVGISGNYGIQLSPEEDKPIVPYPNDVSFTGSRKRW